MKPPLIGDSLLDIVILLWLMAKVGPWQLGVSVYMIAWVLNIWHQRLREKRERINTRHQPDPGI